MYKYVWINDNSTTDYIHLVYKQIITTTFYLAHINLDGIKHVCKHQAVMKNVFSREWIVLHTTVHNGFDEEKTFISYLIFLGYVITSELDLFTYYMLLIPISNPIKCVKQLVLVKKCTKINLIKLNKAQKQISFPCEKKLQDNYHFICLFE